MHHLIMLGKLIPSLDLSTCKTRVSLPRHTVVTGLACFGGSGAMPTENEFPIKISRHIITMHLPQVCKQCILKVPLVSA